MTNLLIMLNLPEKVRNKYYNHLKAAFPEVNVDLADHHSKVAPTSGTRDVLIQRSARTCPITC